MSVHVRHTIFAVLWIIFAVVSLITGLANLVWLVSLMSFYTIILQHVNTAKTARVELNQDNDD